MKGVSAPRSDEHDSGGIHSRAVHEFVHRLCDIVKEPVIKPREVEHSLSEGGEPLLVLGNRRTR